MPPTFTVETPSLTNVRDKVVLITGGSSGIGLSTAELLFSLSSTNRIAILDRAPPPASLTSSQPAERLLFHQCDVTSWKSQRAGFEAAVEKFGRVDVVFVNAGIHEFGDQFFTDELDNEGLLKEPDHRVLDVDLTAAADTVKLAIHYLRRNTGRVGSIILTASFAGYISSAGAPLYSTTKHGTFCSFPRDMR
jgi:NAD(P)-dependent dehydrogenase (short-subunit alcohol dehydrogenase family)